jgi:hypothetical protein
MSTGRLGDRTVGVLRFAALALVAPVFAMPGGAAEAAHSGAAAHPASEFRHGADAVVRTRATTRPAGRAADHTGSRRGDLHAPATINLLAARLY